MAGNQEIREIVLKILAETREGEAGLKRVEDQSKALREEITKAGLGFAAFGAATASVIAVINRGQGVTELTNAFETLSKQAGSLASNELQQLRAATQGLLSDTELMRASNEALAAGLKPEQFRAVAEAADTLGDAFGKNTKVALDDLTRALVTGQEKLLKQYTIQIDNAAAEKKFAESIGLTAKQLNEAGKLEAARIAILEEIKKKTDQLAGGTHTAGDAIQQLGAAFSNSIDTIARFLNEGSLVIALFDDIAFAAQKAATLIEATFGKSLQAQIYQTEQNLNSLKNGTDGFARAFRESEAGKARIFELANELDGLRGKAESNRLEAEKTKATLDKQGSSVEELRKKYTDFGKESEAANKKAEESAKKLTAAQDELKQSLLQATSANAIKPLGDALEKAFSVNFSPGKAEAAFAPFIQSFREATRKELELKFKDQLGDSTTQGLIQGLTDAKVAEQQAEFAKRLEEANKEAFQNSVSFFSDLLTPMFEGQAANFEDIFLDAAKRIAIGFASQMAASLAASLGFGNLGDIGSAGGLGQALAASLGFGGGGVQTLGQILGGGTAAAGGGFIGPSLPGVPAAPVLVGAGAAGGAASTGGILSTLGSLGPLGAGGAIIIGVGAGAGLLSQGIKNQNVLSGGAGGALIGGSLGGGLGAGLLGPLGALASFAGVGDFFGGDSQKAKERESREALLDSIKETLGGSLSFQGFGGQINLNPSKFNVGNNSPDTLNGKIAGLVNPLAQLLTGGDDKLGSDLAGIFTDALGGAENFNEALLNAQVLMGKLGFSAEDAKNAVTELFLDGKISLEEFNTDIQNLNILALDSLPGLADVAGAIELLSKNLDDTERRQALKAIELAFKEMAEAGIDSVSEIHDYILQNFGPDVVKVFDQLAILGIDSFEDLAAAGPEALGPLFGALSELQALMADTGDTGEDAGNQTARAFDGAGSSARRAARETRNYRDELEKTLKKAKELDAFGGSRGDSASQDSNNNLNVRGP